ncbi:cytochrome c oxidase subunit 2A [Deinococcus depolymerans]|uniref:Cytochrome c oxidase subunit 2A n=1 Tax=Deinococcus depolymerans TaxID=392408 RepID=A0ABN1CBV6_9DEIO
MSGPPHRDRGEAPRGTLVVILTLVLSILSLWMLVLGVLQGRA